MVKTLAIITLAIIAAVWGFFIVIGEMHCSVFDAWCPGPEVDAWTGAALFAPIGFPATLCLIIIGITRLFRRFVIRPPNR